MAKSTANTNDRRYVKTQEAIIEALFSFYANHPNERLTVATLCRLAGVSTPTFYRHFKSLFSAAELGHEIIRLELASIVDGNATFFVSLIQVFYFVVNHKNYYLANLQQMYILPFEEIRLVLEPKLMAHIQKSQKSTHPSNLTKWLCYETGNYTTLVLRWWLDEEVCDARKIDTRAKQIVVYVNQHIALADRQARMSGTGKIKNN